MSFLAYVDPGLGLLAWQAVVAAFVGSVFFIRKTRTWLGNLCRKLLRLPNPTQPSSTLAAAVDSHAAPLRAMPLIEKAWIHQTIKQRIGASLLTQVSPDDLLEEQWLEFEDKIQVGDTLWYFRTPQQTWTEFFPRCGMEGYALVRGETVVVEIFTSMSCTM